MNKQTRAFIGELSNILKNGDMESVELFARSSPKKEALVLAALDVGIRQRTVWVVGDVHFKSADTVNIYNHETNF